MKIDTIFLDQSVHRDREVDYLISNLNRPVEPVDDPKEVYDYINRSDDPIALAKKTLYITRNKGAVIRECPGTSTYTCCDYTILHCGTFCTMDCSYCILQSYFHPPVLQYFAGLEQTTRELKSWFKKDQIFRIGTGEYTDSLIWEKISLMPKELVKTFSSQSNCLLELKTKTTHIDSLIGLDHNEKTVIAWSVNTPEIIRSEEIGTAALSARLKAAKKAQEAGYKLAFHFDPIVIYPDCAPAYVKVVEEIFNTIDPSNVVWISLGTFRFMPALKSIIEKRFKDSVICYGEFILGLDNKMRYFKPLRIDVYQTIVSAIRKYAPELLVYFCMEDQEVWEKCMGFFPGREGELGHLLDQSAVSHCKLDSSLL